MKNKKLTYNQLEKIIISLENKYNHAIDTLGKTITDFIEFLGKKEEFIEFLEHKYKRKAEPEVKEDSKKA